MSRLTSLSILLLSLVVPGNCAAQETQPALQPASMFADHMVFQRESDAAVWGTAKSGSSVIIAPSWSDKTYAATADENGKWHTKVKTPKAGGPFQVQITSGSESRVLKDVLVGEVWICSGQSNMQWKMRGFGVDHWKDDVAKAKYPNIRFCDVKQVFALKPQETATIKWAACNPRTALNFSAVGYFFGRKLHQELDVPIGLISTNWGGSSAEAWVSPKTLRKDFPEFNETSDGYAKHLEATGELYPRGKKPPKGLNHRSPAVLHNQMIRPLIPFAFRGVIWYQGESNVKKPKQYRTLFPALIRDWRTDWNAGDFPFYFVQIAPFAYKRDPYSAAYLREAQMMTLSEPNTGMAVTMDIGNEGNIHPKKKKPVADRLARLALARDYGRKDLVDSGPMYEAFKVEDGSIRLSFTGIGGGLMARDDKPLSHFTIAGEDKKFVAAEAKIDGAAVIVSAESVPNPIAVRYGWGSADMPNLSNKAGLPASSFRTDDWPIK